MRESGWSWQAVVRAALTKRARSRCCFPNSSAAANDRGSLPVVRLAGLLDLSYLFFDPEFLDALIALGAEDAHNWLARPHHAGTPWHLEPLEAFLG